MAFLMFSRRTQWELKKNRLTHTLERLREQGVCVLDLTESNPTRCGFQYLSPKLLTPLADPRNLCYEPSAKGVREAREAIVTYYARRSVLINPEQIFLTASTSEAYSFLFHLLCDPDDHVVVPRPSYPLFDYLATLNDVELDPYRLVYQGEWQMDLEGLRQAIGSRTRGIILVNPNNPTGSFVKQKELSLTNQLARQHSLARLAAKPLALIADEVFSDYAFREDPARVSTLATNSEVLTFTLGGLSKSLGLPQMKLSWILTSGPARLVEEALARLEVIADTYLSVATPTQHALSHWLALAPKIQQEIRERIIRNRQWLIEKTQKLERVKFLEPEGGWYAVLRLSADIAEEAFVVRLLEQDHVLVHPGYFFDFEEEPVIVVSLLEKSEIFQEGMDRFFNSLP